MDAVHAFLGTFVLLTVALHCLRPDLDPRRRLLSAYGSGRYSALYRLSDLALSGAAISLAGSLRDASEASRVASALLTVTAAGMAIDALVPMEPDSDVSGRVTTLSGAVHLGAALVAFGAFTAATHAASASRRTAVSRTGRIEKPLVMLTSAGFLALLLAAGPFVSAGYGGIVQRLFAGSAIAWAFAMSRTEGRPGAAPRP